MTTYVVTGCTGFLGRHILTALDADADVRVIGLVRSLEQWRQLAWTARLTRVAVIESEITDEAAIVHTLDAAGVTRADGIFHLAAHVEHSRQNPDRMYETNVEGTLAMVGLASHLHCRVLFVSTSGVVSCFRSPNQWADEQSKVCERAIRRWPYYHSKLEAERHARQRAEHEGVDLVVVRPPVLLGPGDHRFRSTGNVSKMLRGRLPFLVRGGIHFVDVRDVAAALVAAMRHPAPQPLYHLAGTACDLETFFAMVRDVSGVAPPERVLPYRMAHAAARAGALLRRVLPSNVVSLPDPVVVEMASHYWGLRSRHAASDLGFVSRAPLQTLADTVEWLRRHDPALAGVHPVG